MKTIRVRARLLAAVLICFVCSVIITLHYTLSYTNGSVEEVVAHNRRKGFIRREDLPHISPPLDTTTRDSKELNQFAGRKERFVANPGANNIFIGGQALSGWRANHGNDQSTPNQSLAVVHNYRDVLPVQQDKALVTTTLPVLDGSYPRIINGNFIPPHRIVHFDFKGAPPRVDYLEKIFAMISGELGATGVLLEWEDMFPYKGRLEKTRHGNSYSDADIAKILSCAKKYNLEVIPLVQTFGHLEWILKHSEFSHLREVKRYPQVVCLSNPDSLELIKEMIDQVMSAMHKDINYFHIGADEAFQVGMCELCQKNMRENLSGSRERLMIKHIAAVASFIGSKYKKKVLMWHDMLVNMDFRVMQDYNLGALLEPVVWAYAEDLNSYLMPDMWTRFASVFPYIWGASAFKGADGPTRWWSNVPHYLQNHISWIGQMSKVYKSFKEFRGIILTGWQRFDHFAVLCELFPVGIPSLAVNLLTLKRGQYERSVLKRVATVLQCSNILEIESQGIAAYCNFPGFKIYQYVQQLKMSKQTIDSQVLDDYQLRGWLSRFAIKYNYSSAWYLDQIVDKISAYRADLESLSRNLRTEMSRVFFDECVDEFLFEYVQEDLDRLNSLVASAREIAQIRVFPGRPLLNEKTTSASVNDGFSNAISMQNNNEVVTVNSVAAIQITTSDDRSAKEQLKNTA